MGFPAELPGEGLAEMHACIGEQVDVPFRLTEELVREPEEPCLNILFQFDRTPGHSGDAMSGL